MLKKSKTLLVLVLALTFVMSFPGIPFASAIPGDTTLAYPTSQAAIAKILKVPYGTAIIPMTFEFTVTAVTTGAPLKNGGKFTVTFPGDMREIQNPKNANGTPDLDNQHFYLETIDLFSGIDGIVWTDSGEYEYTIKETCTTHTGLDQYRDKLTCSSAEYKVTVYVAYKVDADGNQLEPKELVITHIGVVMITSDSGDEISNGEKLDPTPGWNKDDNSYLHSELAFTNKYVRTNEPPVGPEEPGDPKPPRPPETPDEGTLSISKKVAGKFGKQTDEFNFEITVNRPVLDVRTDNFTAYIMEKVGNTYVTKETLTVTPGTAKEFTLKHNQFLVFKDTPVGSTYAVKEILPEENPYKPSAVSTYGDKTSRIPEAAAGTTLAVPTPQTLIDLGIKQMFVHKTTTKTDFTNTQDGVTPTGLNLNNLPFIAMIALALASLAAFVVVKSRKSKNYN